MNKNQISIVASGIISLIQTGQVIYRVAADAMDSIEQNPELSGASKKEWVLAYVKNIVFELGENWSDYSKLISNFIDNIKTAYNQVKVLFTS